MSSTASGGQSAEPDRGHRRAPGHGAVNRPRVLRAAASRSQEGPARWVSIVVWPATPARLVVGMAFIDALAPSSIIAGLVAGRRLDREQRPGPDARRELPESGPGSISGWLTTAWHIKILRKTTSYSSASSRVYAVAFTLVSFPCCFALHKLFE
jgi:hypothetical protein